MRTRLLFVLSILYVTVLFSGTLDYGYKTGINLSRIYFKRDHSLGLIRQLGYNFILFNEYSRNSNISVITGCGFNERNFLDSITYYDGSKSQADIQLRQVVIPCIFKRRLSRIKIQPFFAVGSQFSYTFQKKDGYYSIPREAVAGETVKSDFAQHLHDKTIDLLLTLGLNRIKVIDQNCFIEFQYSFNLTDYNKYGDLRSSFYDFNFGIYFNK